MRFIYLSALVFLFGAFSLLSQSQDYHPTKLFVKFKQTTSLENIDYAAPQSFSSKKLSPLQLAFKANKVKSVLRAFKLKSANLAKVYTITIEDSAKREQLINALKKLPEIDIVERVPVYHTFLTPNDLHPNQWNLLKINAPQA